MCLILATGCDLSGHKLDTEGEDPDENGPSGDDDDCVDIDQDTWCETEDCNDFDVTVNPGATESCFDLIDNDCDFFIDQDDLDCPETGL